MKRKANKRQFSLPLEGVGGVQLEMAAPPSRGCDDCGGPVDPPAVGVEGYLCQQCAARQLNPELARGGRRCQCGQLIHPPEFGSVDQPEPCERCQAECPQPPALNF